MNQQVVYRQRGVGRILPSCNETASSVQPFGVPTAWLVTAYEFPGRRFYEWALILPIAIPGYIAGFVYAGILNYTSPLYTFFRNRFDIHTGPYFLFDMLSLPGAIFIFSLTLYPYVYLICRAYFAQQSATLAEVSASLGRSPLPTFLWVIIPVARPAPVAGVSLALMEVLNDYGLVRYFGIDTFTTGIFTAWFAFNSLNAALRLSAFLLAFVLLLIALERFHRRRLRFATGRDNRPPARHTPRKLTAALFSAACLAPLLLGFVIPFCKLLYWSLQVLGDVWSLDFWRLLLNSFLLAVTTAILVVMIAVVLAYSLRTFPNKLTGASVRLATLGYALPGAVVAIARAIAPNPSILLFDEPFSNIDSKRRELLRSEIRALVKQTGITSIFVTHDTRDVLAVADRVFVLRQGQTLQSGSPTEVYRHPRNSYIAEFFGKTNLLAAEALPASYRLPFGEVPSCCPGRRCGGRVMLSIRPDAFEIAAPSAPAAFPATLLDCRFCGEYQELTCQPACDDKAPRLAVYVPAHQQLAAETLHLTIRGDEISELEEEG